MHVHPGRCVHPRGSRVLPAYTVRPHTWPGCRHAHPLTPRNNLVRRTQAYPLPGDLCRGVGDAQGQASAVGAEGAPEEGGLPGSRGETGWFALGSQEAWTCPLSAAASGWLSPEGIGKVLRALQVEDVALSVGGAAGRRHSPCGTSWLKGEAWVGETASTVRTFLHPLQAAPAPQPKAAPVWLGVDRCAPMARCLSQAPSIGLAVGPPFLGSLGNSLRPHPFPKAMPCCTSST